MSNTVPYHLCFETLSNDLRLKILHELEGGPKSVSDLVDTLKVEQSRLSHSLSMLRTCHYVAVQTEGKRRIYSIDPSVLSGKPVKNVWAAIDRHHQTSCSGLCGKLARNA